MNKVFFLFALQLCVSCTTLQQPSITVQNEVSSSDKVIPLPLHSRVIASDNLAWEAANAKQVKEAPCRNKLPLTTAEISNYYAKFPHTEESTTVATYRGIYFENELPQLIRAFMFLTTGSEFFKNSLPNDLKSHFKIPATCKKVQCASEYLFGKNVGPQMIFLFEKFDVNTSPYSFPNADLFRADEVADIIRAFELLDTENLPFGKNQKLTKFSRGYTLASYGSEGDSVIANATITLFDLWTEESSLNRQYSLYHEIAHKLTVGAFSRLDRSDLWLRLGNWKAISETEFKKMQAQSSQGHPYVSKYGETNPSEDFAESVCAFRMNPKLLQQQSPEKYKFINTFVYDGITFDTEQNCRQPKFIKTLQAVIDQKKIDFSKEEKEKITKECRVPFYKSLLGHIPTSYFNQCVDFEATNIVDKRQNSEINFQNPILYDKNFRYSFLKFKGLQSELTATLSPEAATWLLDQFNYFSKHDMNVYDSKEKFCSAWDKVSNSLYPGDHLKEWELKSPIRYTELKPTAGAAIGICLDIIQDYQPKSKSSIQKLKEKLNTLKINVDFDPLKERGITVETLSTYIKNRFSY